MVKGAEQEKTSVFIVFFIEDKNKIMENKQKYCKNPDVPAEAIVKQLLIKNGQLKSEVQYLESELANKNRAIKAFKKWQKEMTARTIGQWVEEATMFEEPMLSIETANKIKNIVKTGNRLLSRRKQAVSFAETLKALLEESEIQQLLNNKEEGL